jgi:hypothetical protein
MPLVPIICLEDYLQAGLTHVIKLDARAVEFGHQTDAGILKIAFHTSTRDAHFLQCDCRFVGKPVVFTLNLAVMIRGLVGAAKCGSGSRFMKRIDLGCAGYNKQTEGNSK